MTAPEAYEVTVTHVLRRADLIDVLTTATEGGIGYWCRAEDVVRDDDLGVLRLDGCREVGVDPCWPGKTISLDTVAEGVRRILGNDPACQIRADLLAQVMTLTGREGDADVDADAADCIVQAGLFGEIVYG